MMWRKRLLSQGLIAVCALALLSGLGGCAHSRTVVTPDARDTLAGAPPWALQNAQCEEKGDMVYFVGVSEEQLTSESEALDQAYKDALRRVNDYVGIEVRGVDELEAQSATKAGSAWPYRVTPHMARGLGAFMWPVHTLGSETRRCGSSQFTNTRGSLLERRQWVAKVNVVDTWTVAERFRSGGGTVKPGPNHMRYGQVWKAKVLVAAPKSDLEKRADHWSEYQMHRDEIEMEWREKEWESQHDFKMRQAESLFDKPTFHFMQNTYFHGQAKSAYPFCQPTCFTTEAKE
jgi:hypothetical protein